MYTSLSPHINPWVVTINGTLVARFRRRTEADGCAKTLRGLEPDAAIDMFFDNGQLPQKA